MYLCVCVYVRVCLSVCINVSVYRRQVISLRHFHSTVDHWKLSRGLLQLT